MAKPSARPSTPPGNSPGGSWAFALPTTVLIILGFTVFVLVMEYPLWLVPAAIAITITVGITIRHIITGDSLVAPRLRVPGGRLFSWVTKVFIAGLRTTLEESGADPATDGRGPGDPGDPGDKGDKGATSVPAPARNKRPSGRTRKSASSRKPAKKRTKGAAR